MLHMIPALQRRKVVDIFCNRTDITDLSTRNRGRDWLLAQNSLAVRDAIPRRPSVASGSPEKEPSARVLIGRMFQARGCVLRGDISSELLSDVHRRREGTDVVKKR